MFRLAGLLRSTLSMKMLENHREKLENWWNIIGWVAKQKVLVWPKYSTTLSGLVTIVDDLNKANKANSENLVSTPVRGFTGI